MAASPDRDALGRRVSGAKHAVVRRVRRWTKKAYQPLVRVPFVHERVRPLAKRVRRRLWEKELRHLHDTLESTALAGKYWVCAGVLLGWAREGRTLLHDADADFAIMAEDLPSLEAAVPQLERAGYVLWRRYYNNAGDLTEMSFKIKDATHFDVMVMRPAGGELAHFVYGDLPSGFVECECRIDDQPLVPFDFIGRTWLKHADHERELERMYGQWRVPDPDWSYLEDDLSIVRRQPWDDARVLQSIGAAGVAAVGHTELLARASAEGPSVS